MVRLLWCWLSCCSRLIGGSNWRGGEVDDGISTTSKSVKRSATSTVMRNRTWVTVALKSGMYLMKDSCLCLILLTASDSDGGAIGAVVPSAWATLSMVYGPSKSTALGSVNDSGTALMMDMMFRIFE